MRSGRMRQGRRRRDGLAELVAELACFAHDGLVLLREELAEQRVGRGSWDGCVLSYRRGWAGSVRRDRQGRASNAFSILWDAGRLTDREALRAVDRELIRRSRQRGRAYEQGRVAERGITRRSA